MVVASGHSSHGLSLLLGLFSAGRGRALHPASAPAYVVGGMDVAPGEVGKMDQRSCQVWPKIATFGTVKAIAVFCASSNGHHPDYVAAARRVGDFLARNQMTVVYGGSRIGLMGAVADGALEAGGSVIGVLPRFMRSREIAHEGLTELIMVDSMQERKLRMHELSDGVIALPGGFGTFEELFEMLTWGQLGLHQKPVGLLNTRGYYQHLARMLDHMRDEGLLKNSNRSMLMMADQVAQLVSQMEAYVPPVPDIRMRKDEA